MAGSGGTLTWSTTSVTLAIGETKTVNYTTTFTDVQSANFAPLIASVATFTEGTNKIDLTGTAAGTVTIAANTTVAYETVTTNALTITVMAEDQNFLNERGLAHFWDNIDSAKQNKLTAGSNITINNDTISATQPTVNNATLTIKQNSTTLGTFTANASSNATIDVNAPKLTSLVGSVQTSDYHRSVVALCEVASGSGSAVNSWSSGKLIAHRNNGAYGVAEVDINIEAKRATAYYSNVSYFSNIALLSPTANINTDLGFRPCTFKYNNVYYAGIEFYISSSSASNVYFSGVGNFDVFGLDYYSVSHGGTASSVLNSEVYNSLNYTQWNEERNHWHVGSASVSASDVSGDISVTSSGAIIQTLTLPAGKWRVFAQYRVVSAMPSNSANTLTIGFKAGSTMSASTVMSQIVNTASDSGGNGRYLAHYASGVITSTGSYTISSFATRSDSGTTSMTIGASSTPMLFAMPA